jgi:hypothetical protein
MQITKQNQTLTLWSSLLLAIDISFEMSAGAGPDSVGGLRYGYYSGAAM